MLPHHTLGGNKNVAINPRLLLLSVLSACKITHARYPLHASIHASSFCGRSGLEKRCETVVCVATENSSRAVIAFPRRRSLDPILSPLITTADEEGGGGGPSHAFREFRPGRA